jgi:hypothetical protein
MTISRAIGISSGVGAFLTGIAASINAINPKWGALLAAIGGGITMFCERAHGSPEYRRRKKREQAIKEASDAAQVEAIKQLDVQPSPPKISVEL